MERFITKEYAEILIKILDKAIEEESELWNGGEKSHAYIIGTLLGYIKGIKQELYISSGLYKDDEQVTK